MDILTQRLIALGNKILAELKRLSVVAHSDIEKISSSIDSAAAKQPPEKSDQQPPIQITVATDPQAKKDNEEARESRGRAEGRDRIRLLVEVLALGIGFIVAGANVLLWIQTKAATRIASISASAAQKSASASADQAGATKASIDATVKNFQMDQRAWVGVIGGLPPEGFVVSDPTLPRLGVAISNTGRTPAFQVSTMIAAWPYLKDEKFVPHYRIEEGLIKSSGTEPPNVPSRLWTKPVSTRPFNAEEIRQLQAEERIYKVYGIIQYVDVFKVHHVTHFCMRLISDLKDYTACDTYNDAD